MTAQNRLLLILLPLAAAVVAFWLLAISPKRQEASDLGTKVTELRSQVAEQEQAASAAEAAREEFPGAYRRVVVMGKAAPEDDDTSSLLVQLNRIAESSGVDFVSLEADMGDASAASAPPPAAPEAPAAPGEEPGQPVDNGSDASPAPPSPTEANAALLPIGASIGPAGLPVMKYSLSFEGDFFRLGDFLAGLDELVRSRSDGTVGVKGRLITVDSFDLAPLGSTTAGSPELSATFTITTFLTPPEQGATGGATPAGPAPASEPQSTGAPAPEGTTTTASTETP